MLNYKLFKENGIVLKEIKKINNVYIVSDNKNKYVDNYIYNAIIK